MKINWDKVFSTAGSRKCSINVNDCHTPPPAPRHSITCSPERNCSVPQRPEIHPQATAAGMGCVLASNEAGQLHSQSCRLGKTTQSRPVVWHDVTWKEIRGVEGFGLWTGRGAQDLRGREREVQKDRGRGGRTGRQGGRREKGIERGRPVLVPLLFFFF